MRPARRPISRLVRELDQGDFFRIQEPPCPRRFSHRPPRQLLITHGSTPRPQLPFLYPSGTYITSAQLSRLFSITTSQRKFIKETARQTVRWTVIIFIFSSCFSIASLGVLSERQERAFPSPHEWSLITRFRFRRGKWWQIPENNEEEGFPNWARVYDELDHTLQRLEDPAKDGVDLEEQEEGGILVPGVGKAGFDLSKKSEEWRQGYHEVLMGMALAAERLEGWVTTKGRMNVWAPEFVASPSNPRPKATLPGMPVVPEEDERVPAADPPETFYLKIITTKGFTTHQRLSAALGYADWLAFKKLPDSAEEMYRWALDIALSGLSTTNPSSIIDSSSGVLNDTAPANLITPNLIYAATNLATFHASTNNSTVALPIIISLLRARLSAPEAEPTLPSEPRDSSLVGTVLSLLHEPDYPPLPPTGDEPFLRRREDRCEEAALKSYIGEILFATTLSPPSSPSTTSSQTSSWPSLSSTTSSDRQQRQQALLWTRDAVSTAKTAQSIPTVTRNPETRKKCEKCEEIGLETWGKMMTYLAAEARAERDAPPSWWGVLVDRLSFWSRGAEEGSRGAGKDSRMERMQKKVEELEDEEEGVTMRLNKLRGRMLREELAEMDRKFARTFVF